MEKVKVTIERGKDGKYNAFTDYDLPGYGLLGFGDTAEAAMEDFNASYNEACEMMAEEGQKAPTLSFEFYYDVASFLNFFAEMLSKSGLEKITGINQKQLWHYASGIRKPKQDTVQKIQAGLYHFADTIKQVHFID